MYALLLEEVVHVGAAVGGNCPRTFSSHNPTLIRVSAAAVDLIVVDSANIVMQKLCLVAFGRCSYTQ